MGSIEGSVTAHYSHKARATLRSRSDVPRETETGTIELTSRDAAPADTFERTKIFLVNHGLENGPVVE
jgi:hypothetical protein